MLSNAIKGKKIGATGLTGFLGRHLLPKLTGAEVTYLARPTSIKLPGSAKVITGDCVSGEGLQELISGKDIFIHIASMLFGLSWQDYLSANTRACQNIMHAINSLPEAERPQKIIYISSLSAAGPSAIAPGVKETDIPAPVSAYGWSKLICERILAPLQEKLTIIRPPIIYGSGDRGLLPMFKSSKAGIGVSPGAFRQFLVSAIHASDAASAIILCCQPQAYGIYHISDGNIYTMDVFCKAMAAAQDKKCLMAHVPLPFMALTAGVSTLFSGLKRRFARKPFRAPQWNWDKYLESRQAGWLIDSSRICSELQFKAQMTLANGMREAVAGYRAEGWL